MATKREEEFVGHLMTFDKKGEGGEVIDENVLLEVTQVRNDGGIELAFTDRNERCYVQFNLADLMQHVCRVSGEKVTE
jgi:hypothetical protein